ncbi:MAG: site-2 protease family protein [Acidobacteria bacterium]|nr:MAG: site-2 protease family protein [Acidobacteriota bacterium]
MKWSWKIGTFAGIAVYVHATFLLLIAWLVLSHWLAGQSLAATARGVGFVLALFGCVVLHEFGHALTAARYGIKTRDIILLPIGGLARLERIPENPRQELWVALAGPAVNVVIAGLLFAWLKLTHELTAPFGLGFVEGPLIERLMVANVLLVVFNLIPAFPMDGGRMLRALLAMQLEYAQATQIAANVGQILALFFGFVGLFTNPFLVFIALFVWIGADQEAKHVQMRSMLDGVKVEQVMLTDFHVLRPDDALSRAIALTLAGSQKDFPVVDDAGRVVGVLTQGDLLRGLQDRGAEAAVGSAMQREIERAEVGEEIGPVLLRLQQCACRTLPVTRDGRLAGLLTMENVGELVSIQSALQKRPHARPGVAVAKDARSSA